MRPARWLQRDRGDRGDRGMPPTSINARGWPRSPDDDRGDRGDRGMQPTSINARGRPRSPDGYRGDPAYAAHGHQEKRAA
jgi:hypothetical protein